jgi:hypothetical protein
VGFVRLLFLSFSFTLIFVKEKIVVSELENIPYIQIKIISFCGLKKKNVIKHMQLGTYHTILYLQKDKIETTQINSVKKRKY